MQHPQPFSIFISTEVVSLESSVAPLFDTISSDIFTAILSDCAEGHLPLDSVTTPTVSLVVAHAKAVDMVSPTTLLETLDMTQYMNEPGVTAFTSSMSPFLQLLGKMEDTVTKLKSAIPAFLRAVSKAFRLVSPLPLLETRT